jgi:hypothetical protein
LDLIKKQILKIDMIARTVVDYSSIMVVLVIGHEYFMKTSVGCHSVDIKIGVYNQ